MPARFNVSGRRLKVTTPYERVMARTVEGPTMRPELGPCLDCDMGPSTKGYPRVSIHGKPVYVSRLILQRTLGRPLGEGMCALHHCDRPSCIREDHLYEGDKRDNLIDQYQRASRRRLRGFRYPPEKCGVNRWTAKLTEEAVRVIRFLYARGVTQARLAKAYGVDAHTIRAVLRRESWRHVTDYYIVKAG